MGCISLIFMVQFGDKKWSCTLTLCTHSVRDTYNYVNDDKTIKPRSIQRILQFLVVLRVMLCSKRACVISNRLGIKRKKTMLTVCLCVHQRYRVVSQAYQFGEKNLIPPWSSINKVKGLPVWKYYNYTSTLSCNTFFF